MQKGVGDELPDPTVEHRQGGNESEMKIGPTSRIKGRKRTYHRNQEEHRPVGDQELFHRPGERRKAEGHRGTASHLENSVLTSFEAPTAPVPGLREGCDVPWHPWPVRRRPHCLSTSARWPA